MNTVKEAMGKKGSLPLMKSLSDVLKGSVKKSNPRRKNG